MLTAAQRDAFARDGFLVIEGFRTGAQCASLRARIAELIGAFDPATVRTVFSTNDQGHARDRYFLESGGEIRFFLEAEALDADGRLTRPKGEALNKIGHALHDLDPVFEAFSRAPDVAAVARGLGLTAPVPVQSMYIFKPPFIGGEVTAHQDAAFLMTDPPSCLGFWFALENANETNGCLWAPPGGHREPLRQRFERRGDATTMVTLDPRPLPEDGYVPLAVPQGALIVLHGRLPHRSGPNRSARSRHAYTLHLVDGRAGWSEANWLRRPEGLPFRPF
jgi:phytanoyl-CoA hydroxylase